MWLLYMDTYRRSKKIMWNYFGSVPSGLLARHRGRQRDYESGTLSKFYSDVSRSSGISGDLCGRGKKLLRAGRLRNMGI